MNFLSFVLAVASSAVSFSCLELASVTLGGVTWETTKGWTTNDYDILKLAKSLREGKGWTSFLKEPGAVEKGVMITEEEAQTLNEQLMDGQDPLAIAAVIEAYDELNVDRNSLINNRVPVLIVMGDEDTGFESAKSMARITARSRFKIVSDSNHFTAANRKETIDAILEFVRSVKN
jgi:pimeloyl-ACP methyl ester carboxylesterase